MNYQIKNLKNPFSMKIYNIFTEKWVNLFVVLFSTSFEHGQNFKNVFDKIMHTFVLLILFLLIDYMLYF